MMKGEERVLSLIQLGSGSDRGCGQANASKHTNTLVGGNDKSMMKATS